MKKDSKKAKGLAGSSSAPLEDNALTSETKRHNSVAHEVAVREASGGDRDVQTVKKRGFLESLRKHMSAVAYAESGEFDAARDLMTSSRPHSSILLVIEGASPAASTFDYALNLCTRTRSQLDILQVIEMTKGDDGYAGLRQALSEVSENIVRLMQKVENGNVPVKVTIRLGDVNQKLINYAKRHNEVSMVILDSPKMRGASEHDRTWKKMIQDLAQKLSVPLITVGSRELACAR
ncbi:MAG: universal stress protein [Desulfomonilaceae bacterium]